MQSVGIRPELVTKRTWHKNCGRGTSLQFCIVIQINAATQGQRKRFREYKPRMKNYRGVADGLIHARGSVIVSIKLGYNPFTWSFSSILAISFAVYAMLSQLPNRRIIKMRNNLTRELEKEFNETQERENEMPEDIGNVQSIGMLDTWEK